MAVDPGKVMLEHYGVLGMRWGVRKQGDGSYAKTGSSSDNSRGYEPKNPGEEAKARRKKSKEPKHLRGEEVLSTKLDSGGSLTVRTNPPGPIAKALASKFKSIREVQEKVHDFTLSNEKNEKVGEASFTQTSKDTLELEWIGVRKTHRKKGYATAAMQGVIEYAKDHDITTLNLTATNMGSGIYESLGFKKVGDSEHYDGVYQMTIPKRIKHSSSNDFEIDPKLFGEYIKNSLNKNLSEEDDSDDGSMEHYGVKGMRWGVRKQDDGSKAKTGSSRDDTTGYKPINPGQRKKEAKARLDSYTSGVVDRQQKSQVKKITKSEYNKLDKKPVTVAGKDSNLYRIASKKNRARTNRVTYVTVNEKDNAVYKAILAPEGRATKNRYQMDLKANTKLVSPSLKERVDTYVETLSQDIAVPEFRTTMKGRDFVEDPASKALSNFELGLKTYQTFTNNQVGQMPIHKQYFENLRKKGYNALIDDADKDIVTDLPVILLNAHADSTITGTRKITKDEQIDAQLGLRDRK